MFIYCSSEQAKQILSNSKLRWSSPSCSQDPLQLNHRNGIGFDRDTLLASAIKLTKAMIFSTDHPKGDSPIINAIKRWRDEERFNSPDEAEVVLKELLARMVDQKMDSLKKLVAEWQVFIQSIRCLSLFEKADNMLAWQQYAENHRGAALRFNLGEKSLIEKAELANYSANRPELTSTKEQIAQLLHNQKDNSKSRFRRIILIRPQFRASEREWISTKLSDKKVDPESPSNWSEDLPFKNADFSGVYFGIETSDEDKAAIKAL